VEKIFDRIIVPIDGSDFAKNAAEKAFVIANKFDLEVIVICVLDPIRYSYSHDLFSSYTKIRREQAERYIDEIIQIGQKFNVKYKTRLVDGSAPLDEIIKSANQNDLIIIGSKGHSNIEKILIGSVSEKVVRHAKCSVMVVR
jgi:nucleotide-binding universal stress UspA family protein